MTLGEVSQEGPGGGLPADSLPAMRLYAVTDESGTFPMLWDEAEPPKSSAHVSWHLVAEVDSIDEADAVIDALGLDPYRRHLPMGEASGPTSRTSG